MLEGALEHKDTLGTGSVIRPGDVQLMSAGTGVAHSEFNHSHTEGVHFLQIWIVPNVAGATPNYREKHFSPEQKRGRLQLIISPEGENGALKVRQTLACTPACSMAMKPRPRSWQPTAMPMCTLPVAV